MWNSETATLSRKHQPPRHLFLLRATYNARLCTHAVSFSVTRQSVACVCACIGWGCCHEEIAAPSGTSVTLCFSMSFFLVFKQGGNSQQCSSFMNTHSSSLFLLDVTETQNSSHLWTRRMLLRVTQIELVLISVFLLISAVLCSAHGIAWLSVSKFCQWDYKVTRPCSCHCCCSWASYCDYGSFFIFSLTWDIYLCIFSSIFMCTTEALCIHL